MAVVAIDVKVNNGGAETTLRQTATAFQGVDQAVMKAQMSLVKLATSHETLSSTQQRAVMRMESMHEEIKTFGKVITFIPDDGGGGAQDGEG